MQRVHVARRPGAAHELTCARHDEQLALDDLHLHGPERDEDGAPDERDVWFLGSDRALTTRIYQRDRLRPGMTIAGPAIIEQLDATTVVYPGDSSVVDDWGNLIIELEVEKVL